MVRQNCELHEWIVGREWLRSTNFYLSTKSRGWNGGHFRFQIRTGMTCGRMEFRFSERVYIHRFACLGRFYHWHQAGECSLLGKLFAIVRECIGSMNLASRRCSVRFEWVATRRLALWVAIDCITQLWNPSVKFACKGSEVLGGLRLILILLSQSSILLYKEL